MSSTDRRTNLSFFSSRIDVGERNNNVGGSDEVRHYTLASSNSTTGSRGSKFPLLDVTKYEGHRRVILTSFITSRNCIRLVRPRTE